MSVHVTRKVSCGCRGPSEVVNAAIEGQRLPGRGTVADRGAGRRPAGGGEGSSARGGRRARADLRVPTGGAARAGLGGDVDLDQGVLRISRALSHIGGTAQLGPTRTASTRREPRLPTGTGDALRQHRARQLAQQGLEQHWVDLDLVPPTRRDTLLDPADLRRAPRTVTEKAALVRWHRTSWGTSLQARCQRPGFRWRRSPTCSGTRAPAVPRRRTGVARPRPSGRARGADVSVLGASRHDDKGQMI